METSLEQWLTAAVTAGSRLTGLFLAAPFFASAGVPVRMRIALAVLLTVLLVPVIPPQITAMTAGALVPLLAGEIAIGFLLGFTAQLVMESVRLAGQIMGVQMGYSLASVMNPDSDADSTVIAIFQELVALMLLLQLQVPQSMLRLLARSFRELPPGAFSLQASAVSSLFGFAAKLWSLAVQLAAPVLVATVFTDVALGLLGKASPQLPVLFVGLSVKNVLGLVLLSVAMVYWPSFFETHFRQALELSGALLRLVQ